MIDTGLFRAAVGAVLCRFKVTCSAFNSIVGWLLLHLNQGAKVTSKLRLALFASLSLYFIGSAAPSLAQSLTINSVGPPTQVGSGTGKRA
ncbi:MAG: hypothetical protein AAGG72_10555, partial [Pseudomonadota bacterium]